MTQNGIMRVPVFSKSNEIAPLSECKYNKENGDTGISVLAITSVSGIKVEKGLKYFEVLFRSGLSYFIKECYYKDFIKELNSNVF